MKKNINYYRKLGYNWEQSYITHPFRSFGAEIAWFESQGYRLAPLAEQGACTLYYHYRSKEICECDRAEYNQPYPVYIKVVKTVEPLSFKSVQPLEAQLASARAKVLELEAAIEKAENISIPFRTIKEFAEYYSKTDCYFDSTSRERFLQGLLARAKK